MSLKRKQIKKYPPEKHETIQLIWKRDFYQRKKKSTSCLEIRKEVREFV